MSAVIEGLIAIAKAEVGYKEKPNNDNKYGIWFHWNHVPWCAIFVSWVFAEAGAGSKLLRTAGCEAMEAWAIKNKLTVPIQTVKAGDVVLFDFNKSGKAQHIGIATGVVNPRTHLVPTIEGNTGDVNQVNGDGVYIKRRNMLFVRTVIRPRY